MLAALKITPPHIISHSNHANEASQTDLHDEGLFFCDLVFADYICGISKIFTHLHCTYMWIRDEIQTKRTRSRWKWILLLALLLLWAYIARQYWYIPMQQAEHGAAPESTTVQRRDITRVIEGEWKITGNDTVTLWFEIAGKLESVLVEPGQKISAWQTIAKIDDERYINALNQAKNALAQAQSRATEASQPLSTIDHQKLQKQQELDQIAYQEQTLQIENKLRLAQDRLKRAEVTKTDQLYKIENSWLDSTKQIELLKIWHTEQMVRLEQDAQRLETQIRTYELQLTQLEQDKLTVSTDDDTQLQLDQEDAKRTQAQAWVTTQLDSFVREMDSMLTQIDLFLWVSSTNQYANDQYERLISAKNTSLKRDAENTRRTLRNEVERIQNTPFGPPLSAQTDMILWHTAHLVGVAQRIIAHGADMWRLIDNSVSGWSFQVAQIDQRRSTFLWLTDALGLQVTQMQSQMEALRLTESASATIIDSSDDQVDDRLMQIDQQIEQVRQSLDDTRRDLELKLLESEQTKKRYDLDLRASEQQYVISQAEIESSKQLTQLDYETTREEINQLTAELAKAKQRHATSLELSTIDTQSKKDPLSAAAKNTYALQVEANRLSVQEKELQLAQTVLSSPVNGTVLSVTNDIWEYPSTGFVTLTTAGKKYIEVFIEEEEVNNIRIWQEALVTVDAFEGIENIENSEGAEDIWWWDGTYAGVVYHVSASGVRDANDIVTYQVLITLDDRLESSRSQMTVTVEFVRDRVVETLTIPLEYIVKRDGKDMVRISEQEWEEGYRQVTLGMRDDEYVQVVRGLSEGEVVFVGGEEE